MGATRDGSMIGPGGWRRRGGEAVAKLLGRGAGREQGGRRERAAPPLAEQRARIDAELARLKRPDLAADVRSLPEHFVLARAAASVAAHLALADGPLAPGQVRTRIRETDHPEAWELLVVARDRPGLLATMAGVLALHGLSVLSADAATRDEGIALDAFDLVRAPGTPPSPRTWSSVATVLAEVLSGRRPLDERIEERHGGAADAPPVVTVDNARSPVHTVVEVRGQDRPGLLYRVARALHELGLDIRSAEIETHPNGVVDCFCVRGLDGLKLDDERAAGLGRKLEDRLAARLGHEAPAAPTSRSD
jgi:[protein-PII] uridylyltransferase